MNNNNNKLLWVVIALTIVMVVVGIGSKVFVDKVANRVIQKLQKDYSPSPYGPGIDPDKLDAEKLKSSTAPAAPPFKAIQPTGSNWTEDWENQRK
jgi:hypothetical protein